MDYKALVSSTLRWGLCTFYTIMTIYRWEIDQICIQRINVVMTIVFLIGIDKCISILRIFLQEQSLDFEVTMIMLIVYIQNKRFGEECMDTTESLFENVSLYLFFIILVSNSLYFCLVILFLIVSLIQYYYLYSSNIYNDSYFDQNGISEEKLLMLVIPLSDKFKDDDCGICLAKLNEQQRSSAENLDKSRSEKVSQNSKEEQNQNKIHFNTIICIPNCLHKYHYLCVREWFKNHTTCPFCRQNIKDIFNNHNYSSINNNSTNINANLQQNILPLPLHELGQQYQVQQQQQQQHHPNSRHSQHRQN